MFGYRNRFKRESKTKEPENNQIKEVKKTIIIEKETITNNEIPKKTIEERKNNSQDKKEKYRFKKRENKEKKDNRKSKENKKDLKIEEINDKSKKNKLKEDFKEIQKVCIDKTLKKNLLELHEKVVEDNADFMDKIFFKNLLHTETKVGNMDPIDDNKISHTIKEIPTKEILRNIPNLDSLIQKYTLRTKRIYDEN